MYMNSFTYYILTDNVHELFAKCSQTNQTISMHDEWIFAGKIVYNPTDVHEQLHSSCDDRDYELTINADYSERLEDLRLMFRVETENNYGTPFGNNDSVCHLQISDGSTLNKSKLRIDKQWLFFYFCMKKITWQI